MAVVAKTQAPSASQKQNRRERIQKLKLAGRAYLWLAPLILAMAVIVYYPLITGFILSFTNADQTNIATQIGTIS